MSDIAIRHLHSRLRCPPGTDAQPRLRRILAEAVNSGLEAAIGRRGLPATGEVCLREIQVQARLNLREADSVLSAELAMAIADGIAAGIGENRTGCIHYSSRAEALADFAAATLSGDFRRAWAWRQLGIRSAGFAVSVSDAAGQVLIALSAEPRQAIAILAGLTEYPILFERLLSQAPPQHWAGLGGNVAEALGASPDLLFRPREPLEPWSAAHPPARRILARSVIARALRVSARPEWLAGELLPVSAFLILGEVEPALLQAPREHAQAWVRAVGLALMPAGQPWTARGPAVLADSPETAGQGASEGQTPFPESPMSPDGPNTLREPASATASDRSPESMRVSGEGRTVDAAGSSDDMIPVLEFPPEIRVPSPLPLGPASADAAPEGGRRSDRIPLAPGRFDLPGIRRRGHTRFGGLLYLINLIERIGSVERIRKDPRLAARTPRWCLHRLALALVPVPDSDPAALAFAGLLPGSEPPSANQSLPTEPEAEALAERAGELLQALCERLARPDEDESARLDYLCRRPAEILADPGWLEAHFALDQVATDIRAAGLDLDPGWVPWLGVVMRFVYV